jgi:hypothetical protein
MAPPVIDVTDELEELATLLRRTHLLQATQTIRRSMWSAAAGGLVLLDDGLRDPTT